MGRPYSGMAVSDDSEVWENAPLLKERGIFLAGFEAVVAVCMDKFYPVQMDRAGDSSSPKFSIFLDFSFVFSFAAGIQYYLAKVCKGLRYSTDVHDGFWISCLFLK